MHVHACRLDNVMKFSFLFVDGSFSEINSLALVLPVLAVCLPNG